MFRKMTWSIIARDYATGHFGIAVATRFFAVGARVPYIAAGVGAIATQALVNPYYGIDGLKLLREGKSPREIVDALKAADSGHASRQLHIMDAAGHVAAYTGRRLRRLVRAYRRQRFFDRRQHAGGRGRAARYGGDLYRQRETAVRATPDRGDVRRRSRRRRQARQAIGGAADPWRRGMVGARPARRRPCRSA